MNCTVQTDVQTDAASLSLSLSPLPSVAGGDDETAKDGAEVRCAVPSSMQGVCHGKIPVLPFPVLF